MALRLYKRTAAGTALTNSTSHTRLDVATIPAASMKLGKSYRAAGTVRATATNSTNTLRCRVLLGPTTLTGTAIADSGALDVTNDDIFSFDLEITPRAISATAGICIVTGSYSVLGASGTVTRRAAFTTVSSLNTLSAAQLVEITGLWDTANAGNSCQCEDFVLEELVVGM